MMFARKPVLPIHFISGDDTSLMESVVSDESGEECLFDYSEIKKNLQMIKEVHNKVLQEASSSIKKAQEYQKGVMQTGTLMAQFSVLVTRFCYTTKERQIEKGTNTMLHI